MHILIVIGEKRCDRVGATCQHARWCLFEWCRIALHVQFRWIRANHMRHIVNWYGQTWCLLHVFQTVHDFALNNEIDADSVLDAFFDCEYLHESKGGLERHSICPTARTLTFYVCLTCFSSFDKSPDRSSSMSSRSGTHSAKRLTITFRWSLTSTQSTLLYYKCWLV